MKIGFDAKRALNNSTGLGNHARILLNGLHQHFPEHDYHLYTPQAQDRWLHELNGDFELHFPQGMFYNTAPALWRSYGVVNDLRKQRIDIYHGLSNEIPYQVHNNVRGTVVTIHDLIFLKHTVQYPFLDRKIYELKTRYAAKHAHKIIAVSNETKAELINYYNLSEQKIEVIYPAVDELFEQVVIPELIQSCRAKFALPEQYILNVGSFFPRKNQLTLVRAFNTIKNDTDVDLVLVGSSGFMLNSVKQLVAELKLTNRVHFILQVSSEELPAIYAGATVFVFPSLYEGFGAPVVEALWQKVPVVTTENSAMQEAAGNHSLFANPLSYEDIAEKILLVLNNPELKMEMAERGYTHAQNMSAKHFAAQTMQLYKQLI
ncbi:MAG: glycosyltransferase family 4 protein [Chitinophagales bacterium]|nr:glycosyltransferase family 4 protein [Chitinophagales bacterium]